MKKAVLFAFLGIVFALPFQLSAQAPSTAELVYNLFQTQGCANNYCHGGGQSPDLLGSGATLQDKIDDVRNNLYDATPSNTHAAGEGWKLVYPGDPYRSFLFRKLHNGFDPTLSFDSNVEGDPMPKGMAPLRDEDIELVRQWIIQGAPTTGTVVDTTLIHEYYAGNGIASYGNPPPAPLPGEGFQVHLGPFFVGPNGEEEFYAKYRTDLPVTSEVYRVQSFFGNFSHHFILYLFIPGQSGAKPYGLREDAAHYESELVSSFQYPEDVRLPLNTAFEWHDNAYLDLNTHYINYDFTKVLACDVYFNIYTQSSGTAQHVMQSELIANPAIFIPNDGQNHSFESIDFSPLSTNTKYIWQIGSHTHKYGTGFQVWTRNLNGSKDDMIYDASKQDGDPLGLFIGFDYQHPPLRRFFPFLTVNDNEGLIYKAEYVNNGPFAVGWGPTSDDEMMVMAYYYTRDTAGIAISRDEEILSEDQVSVFPNPASDKLFVEFENQGIRETELRLYDLTGKLIHSEQWGGLSPALTHRAEVNVQSLAEGSYFYLLLGEGQKLGAGKVLIQH